MKRNNVLEVIRDIKVDVEWFLLRVSFLDTCFGAIFVSQSPGPILSPSLDALLFAARPFFF